MAITVQGSGSSVTTTVTIPAHAVGDMIVIMARGTVAPTAPAAGGTVPTWTTPTNQTGVNNSVGWRLSYAIATGTTHTSGTWTNAAQMHVLVLRGGRALSVGNDPAQGGANNTQTMIYPAFTLTAGQTSNLVVRYGARITADTEVRTSGGFATGGTFRTEQPATTPTSAVFTKPVTASEGTFTATTAGTNAAYRCGSVEILEAPPATVTRSASVDIAPTVAAAGQVGFQGVFGLEARLDASTIGLADGASVSTWSDLSGRANHFTQATGGSQPTYQTNELNSLPVVRFDGTDDYIVAPVALRANDATRTIFCVARVLTPVVSRNFWGWGANARMNMTGAGAARWSLDGAGAQVILGTMGTAAHVLAVRFNSTSSADVYFDSGSATNFDPDDTYQSATSTNLAIGAQGAGTNPGNVDIGEFLVFDSALSDTDVNTIRSYLSAKWIYVPTTVERSASVTITPAVTGRGAYMPVEGGGTATAKLSTAPPDTTGYTTRTITQAEAEFDSGVLRLSLDPATDYIIDSPYPIKRTVRLEGGRNIVWIGAHIQINERQALIEDGSVLRALHLIDAGGESNRTIHIEGHWWSGSNIQEGVNVQCPTARVYFGHVYSEGRMGVASTDQHEGTNYYQWAGHHPDNVQRFGGDREVTWERCTFLTADNGWHYDEAANNTDQAGYIKNCNVRAIASPMTQEGPLTQDQSRLVQGTVRRNFDAGISAEGINNTVSAVASSSVTANSSTPINGAGSLTLGRGSQTATPSEIRCVWTLSGVTDWSANEGLSIQARLDAGGGAYPMGRIDVTTNASADASKDWDDWWLGTPHQLESGVTRTVQATVPPAIASALRRIRFVFLTDGTLSTHTVTLDDFRSCDGRTLFSFGGPAISYEGKWGLYKDSTSSGPLYVEELYAEHRANNAKVGSTTYFHREWNGSSYDLDPPPGTATLADFLQQDHTTPTETRPTGSGADGIGDYVSWTSAGNEIFGINGTQPARIYEGPPPGGDYVDESVAGVNYVPLGYIGTHYRTASITLTPAVASAQQNFSVLERSASVTLTPAVASTGAVEAGAFSPTSIAGLECWLKADAIGLSDGANVTTWEDSHTSNKDGTSATGQTYETNEINGLPVVRFDGVDDTMAVSGITNNDATRTVFCVQRNLSHATTADAVWGFTNTSKMASTQASPQWRQNQTPANQTIGSGVVLGTAFHTTIRFNSTSSADAWVNGTQSANFDPADAYQATGTALAVGSRTGGDYANVEIGEFLVYNSALSGTDVGLVQDYLTDKWIGVGPTVYERSASVTITPAVASAQQNFSVLERSAAIAITPAVVSAPQRVRLRSAAITLTPAVASAATFYSILTRSAAVAITPAIATAPRRVLLRATAVTLTPHVEATGQIEGGLVVHQRSASVTITPGIASAATFYSILERSVAVTLTPAIATAQIRVRIRSAAITIAPSVASSGAARVTHLRSVAITITPSISAAGFAGTIFQTRLPLTVEVRDASLTVAIDEGDTSIIFDSSESTVIYDETTTDVTSQGDRDADVPEHLTSVDVAEPVTTVDYDETQRTVEVA